MKIYKCILFLLLLSATVFKNVIAKIDYEEFSDDRGNNFEDLAVGAEKNLINNAITSKREKLEAGKNDSPVNIVQRKINSETNDERNNDENVEYVQYDDENANALTRDDDASMEAIDSSKSKKAFAADQKNGEELYNGDESFASDDDAQENEGEMTNNANSAKHSKHRFSSNNKFIRSEPYKSSYAETNKNKVKQAMQLSKRKICDKGKLKSDKARGKYTDEIKRKTDSKESVNDCPTRTFQSNSNNEVPEKKFIIEKKREKIKRNNRNWSQDQLNALSYSLSKIRDDSSEFENLKNILYDMGLANNMQSVKKRYSESLKASDNLDSSNENLKRETQEESEDEDMTKNNIVVRRNEATNKNSKRETSDNKDEFKKRETNAEVIHEDENEELSNSKIENNNNKLYVKRSNNEKNNDALRNTRQEAQANTEAKSDVSKDIDVDEDKFEETQNNKENVITNSGDNRKKRNDTTKSDAYQKRMEDQIQAKIDAIKEKVKREIERQEQVKKREVKRQKKDLKNNEEEERNQLNRKRRYSKKSNVIKKSANTEEKQLKDVPNESALQGKSIRKKRANRISEQDYRPYQEQEENDLESEEFNDSENEKLVMDKRLANDEYQYEPSKRDNEEYDEPTYQEMYQNRKKRRYLDDAYSKDDSQYQEEMLQRRAPYTDNNDDEREKRSNLNREQSGSQKSEHNENAAENEYFGPLPEAYDGELNRYKRVKRDQLKYTPDKK